MRLQYSLDKSEAYKQQEELLHRLHSPTKLHISTAITSILLSIVWPYFNYPAAEVNGEQSSTFSLVLASFIQVPIGALILYFLSFFFRRSLSKGVIKNTLNSQPSDVWGERSLTIENSEINLTNPITATQFPTSRVTDITETYSAYFLYHSKTLLLTLPRSVCTRQELDNALSSKEVTPPALPQS